MIGRSIRGLTSFVRPRYRERETSTCPLMSIDYAVNLDPVILRTSKGGDEDKIAN